MTPTAPVRNFVAALLVACALTASGAERAYTAGERYFGRSNYVEYIAGDLPVVREVYRGGARII